MSCRIGSAILLSLLVFISLLLGPSSAKIVSLPVDSTDAAFDTAVSQAAALFRATSERQTDDALRYAQILVHILSNFKNGTSIGSRKIEFSKRKPLWSTPPILLHDDRFPLDFGCDATIIIGEKKPFPSADTIKNNTNQGENGPYIPRRAQSSTIKELPSLNLCDMPRDRIYTLMFNYLHQCYPGATDILVFPAETGCVERLMHADRVQLVLVRKVNESAYAPEAKMLASPLHRIFDEDETPTARTLDAYPEYRRLLTRFALGFTKAQMCTVASFLCDDPPYNLGPEVAFNSVKGAPPSKLIIPY